MPETRERWRNRLPHWEVADRAHFVTIRCAGSLPQSALPRIRAINANLSKIDPADPEFAQPQRQYFLTCEKYLDHPDSAGFAPFRDPVIADLVLADLRKFGRRDNWTVQAATIMPNHVHFLLHTESTEPDKPLREVLRAFKGRTARQANQLLGRTGSFWQREWFDRWMRDEREVARTTDYIRQNPVKAGLLNDTDEWHWQI